MKRIYNLIITALAVISFVSCENVPMPYQLNTTPTVVEGVYVSETFATSFGTFAPVTITGTPWVIAYSTAKATGWDGSSTTPSESYLISPAINLSESENAYMKFEYILRYASSSPHKVLYSLDYNDDPTTATWVDITGNLTEGSDWNTFYDYLYQFPAEVIGQSNVRVALYYSCDNNKSITWEVKNLSVREGTCEIEDVTPGEADGDGSLENPYNAVAANAYIRTLATDAATETDIYVKGKISKLKEGEAPSASYGNATFWISENGDVSEEQFYVYRCLGPGNQKFASGYQLNIGDEVIICGKVIYYSGNTPETVSGKSYLYSHNGNENGAGETPEITGENLLTNGDFETWENGLPTNWKSASTAGNATLSQSTDAHGGSYSVAVGFNDTQNKRLAYKELTLKAGTYEWSFYAKATTSNKSQCEAGYVPVTNGTVGNYTYDTYIQLNNTSWTQVSYTFTLSTQTTICLLVMNPKTSNYATAQEILIDDAALRTNDGGLVDGDTPSTPDTPAADAEGNGTEAAPYNIAGVLGFINTLGADVQSNERVYIKGKISTIVNVETSTYGNAQFKISDDGTTANEFMCYNCFYLGNTKFTSANQIKVGDEVIIYGKVVNYRGNTPETVTKEAYIYKLNGSTTETGNDTPDDPGTGGDVTTDGYDVSIAMSSLELGNAAEVGTTTAGDFTFTGEKGTNSNAPKYYNAGTNIRMYPGNSLTISTSKKIEALLLHCDTYNNIVCVAEGKVSAEPGTVAVNGALIGITGIGSESVTIKNIHSGTGTVSHIRIVSIDVKYAE